ncbi:MAG: glycosyltransferase [Chlamydiia bacterium]|nr:glycosyltransferase [Chlamydiia bacterium]
MRCLILLFSALSLSAQVSILIPCHPAHFPLLEELLTAYTEQTALPDEVVISLSQYEQIDPSQIAALESKAWPFQLLLLKHPQKCAAGTNRKLAARASTGKILICQDADDLPHPQRVEIVKHLFEKYAPFLLIHSYAKTPEEFVRYDKESISLQELTQQIIYSGIPNGPDSYIPIHHGNVCLSKVLSQYIVWDDDFMGGEDFRLNLRAWQIYRRKCCVIPQKLILFRGQYSYFSNTPPHLR